MSVNDPVTEIRAALKAAGIKLPARPRAPSAPRITASIPAAQLAATIDHTLLRPDATRADVLGLCDEAAAHGFASVCVNAVWVPEAVAHLADRIAVCTVVGFPLGATTAQVKTAEAAEAVKAGATEVDMVLAVGLLRSAVPERAGAALDGRLVRRVHDDVQAVVRAARGPALVKVILETCLLSRRQKIAACLLSVAGGADFVKTSTGFSSGGATVADVKLMRSVVGAKLGVKASGGIRTRADALRMLRAGASRLGCSAGLAICGHA